MPVDSPTSIASAAVPPVEFKPPVRASSLQPRPHLSLQSSPPSFGFGRSRGRASDQKTLREQSQTRIQSLLPTCATSSFSSSSSNSREKREQKREPERVFSIPERASNSPASLQQFPPLPLLKSAANLPLPFPASQTQLKPPHSSQLLPQIHPATSLHSSTISRPFLH